MSMFSPWREMMYPERNYQDNSYDCRELSHSQMECSGTTDSDSGHDSGVIPHAMPRDVMMSYDRRVPLSSSSTYSENNYAEIPGNDTFTPYRHQHPASRYIPDLPGNYMFSERLPHGRPHDLLPHDLPRSGNQGSPDSGVALHDRMPYPVSTDPIQTTVPLVSLSVPANSEKLSELATIPLPDRRAPTLAECEFYQRHPEKPKKRRSALHNIFIMAAVGLAYLALGITAGYFIGKGACGDCEPLPCPTTLPVIMPVNDTEKSTTMTTTPSTTTTTTTTTPAPETTTELVVTTQPPSFCVQENGFCRCGPFGGDAEREFSDRTIYLQNGNVTSFSVNHNDYFIGSIQFWYGKTAGPQHGYTTSGYEVKVDLVQNEVITDVQVDFTSGKSFLTRLEIYTNLRRLGPYGGQGGLHMPTQGGRLLYVSGRAGSMIDQLTLYYDRCLL